MKYTLAFRSFLVAAICAFMLNGCMSPVGPASNTPTYFIVPDSIVCSLYGSVSFAAHTADLSAQTYKYVWTFGDGGGSTFFNSNLAGNSYNVPGTFQVKVLIYDPQNNLLGTAFAKVVVPGVSGTVSLSQHTYITNNDTTIFQFRGLVQPDSLNRGAIYTWSIDDTLLNYDASDTLSHIFTTPGVHKVKVSAQYGYIDLGSDSAMVTVTLPTATTADLAAMNLVSVTVPGKTANFSITLPLQNGNGYTLTQSGLSLNESYFSWYHQQVSSAEVVDSLRTRTVGVTLSSDGRHLSLNNASILDSFFIAQPTQNVEHILRASYNAPELKLISKSADSIVFRWVSTEPYGTYSYKYIDTTFDPTKLSNTGTSNGSCPTPSLVVLTAIRGSQSYYQPQTVVFRKQ